MKMHVLLVAMGSLCAVAGWSQTSSGSSAANMPSTNGQSANSVCRIYFQKPKPGMTAQFEQARKQHFQFHKSQNDSWAWHTSVIETGPNTGTYVVSTCGHTWKDFDDWEKKMGKPDMADAMSTMGPTLEDNTNRFFTTRADLSLATSTSTPAPMVAVTIYELQPLATDDFVESIKKISDALRKDQSWPKTSTWLQLANGGEAPSFVVVNERQGWADYASPEKSVRDIVTAAYGKETADSIYKTLRGSIAHVYTETGVSRPDLSYEPSK